MVGLPGFTTFRPVWFTARSPTRGLAIQKRGNWYEVWIVSRKLTPSLQTLKANRY